MKKQLQDAYDRMTMPDGCSHRIEAALRQKLDQGKPHARQTKAVRAASGRGEWLGAVAAVCMAALLSVGGVALFVGLPKLEPSGLNPSHSASAPSETSGTDISGSQYELTQEGKNFLQTMCLYLPDFEDSEDPGNKFWTDFIFRSFTSPEIDADGVVQTIAGPAEMTEDRSRVRVSRSMADAYVRTVLGRDLPDFDLSIQGLFWPVERVEREEEEFLVSVSDFGSVEYRFFDWRYSERGGVQYTAVSFVTADGEQIVEFLLLPAENENGFIIARKRTEEVLGSVLNGEYIDETTGETALKLLENGDGTVLMQVTIHRIATMDCIGVPVGDKLYFSSLTASLEEQSVYGTFTMPEPMGRITITSPGWTDDRREYEFVRSSDETDLTMPDPVPGTIWEHVDETAQKLVMTAFTENYIAGDWQGMSYCAVPDLELNAFSHNTPAFASLRWEILDAGLYGEFLETFDGGEVGYVQFRVGSDPTIWELTMELDKLVDGWKVRHYSCAEAGDHATGRGQCQAMARDFTQAFLAGDLETMNAMLPYLETEEDMNRFFPGDREMAELADLSLDPEPESNGVWTAAAKFRVRPDTSTWVMTMNFREQDGKWTLFAYNVFQ